ncbi:CorA family divalent cation transporter [Pseudidiomarina terrestris]|uniref:CorA family divalent cation transporter n=1 Tax=Pseudidiomarina terrestris TaxID=2820060 RepID=UPI0026550535|nr:MULTISPECIES: CorA family divalent cation transporter [unclassified Pseudidiomarina]MDN7126799.1 zinc transporter ZntB [Pseudidiomarina sp. 1APR75-33.1]MDN7134680.1 zinc transporter ZntB [Pseudidiomarina sp. 1ASP75-5]MDN7136650.1 zinc transporter ZntB [Pseudidiomarina sp. 1ASP75-14]
MTEQRPEFMIDSWDFSTHPAQAIESDFHDRQNSWFHIQRDQPGIQEWLQNSGIPEPLIDAVLEEDTRPRFERNAHGFLLILKGVNLTEGERPEDMLSLRILYYKGNIYSFRKRPLRSVGVLRERLKQQQGPESLHDFLVMLIEEINNRLEELLDVIEAEMEQLEDDTTGGTSERQRHLTQLHRRMLRLVRFVRPQLTAIERLAVDAVKWLETDNVQWLVNERDSTQRELESLEMLLEQVWMLREHLQQEVAEKMNRNTYWLSVIAGVFLPISFLTGVFGINIGGMPGVESDQAFWIFCGSLAVIAVVEFLLLRRLRFW